MCAADLLIVGPAEQSTGGVAQYLTEQQKKLPNSVDVTVHDDGTTGTGLAERPAVATARTLRGIVEFPTRNPPDVVHVHSSHGLSFYRAAAYVFYASSVWDAGIVFHVHGSSFDDFLEDDGPVERRVQSAVFARCDVIIVLSDYWRRAFEGYVPVEKLRVVPNAVQAGHYDPAQIVDDRKSDGDGDSDGLQVNDGCISLQPETPTVTFVSNHVRRKGIVDLVEAIDKLQRNGSATFKAKVAGDGPESDCAEALAARHEDVEYLGYVSEGEKRVLLANSSVYALPSYAEGLPIALLEGMAAGNAVVTTGVGSIPEVVDHKNGRLVTPGDINQLTDRLSWLLKRPDAVARMGARNYRLIRREYSWDTVIDRLLSIYESVST